LVSCSLEFGMTASTTCRGAAILGGPGALLEPAHRGVGWRGYKAHFTETSEPDRPHLIVHVATTVATTADVDTMPARHAALAGTDLLPDEHLVDASYVSVDGVLAARADHGVELVGPQDCTPCPDRARCTRTPVNPGISPPTPPPVADPASAPRRAGHPGLAGALRAPLRDRGHIAQAARRSDLHHARYRGLPKTHLQHVLIALALNLVRVGAWLTGTPLGGSWVSRLTRLRLVPSPV
jgi:Transposase DDE domain